MCQVRHCDSLYHRIVMAPATANNNRRPTTVTIWLNLEWNMYLACWNVTEFSSVINKHFLCSFYHFAFSYHCWTTGFKNTKPSAVNPTNSINLFKQGSVTSTFISFAQGRIAFLGIWNFLHTAILSDVGECTIGIVSAPHEVPQLSGVY